MVGGEFVMPPIVVVCCVRCTRNLDSSVFRMLCSTMDTCVLVCVKMYFGT